MPRKAGAVLLGLMCCCTCAAMAQGDDAEKAKEVFESVFGQDLAAAKASPDLRDDLVLAEKMLATARESTAQPAFLAFVCEAACDLAQGHRDGWAMAAEAIELLARHAPEKAAPLRERLVDLRQRQFDAAPLAEKPESGEDLLDLLIPLAEDRVAAGDLQAAVGLYRRVSAVAKAAQSVRYAEAQERVKWLGRASAAWDEAEKLRAVASTPAERENVVRLYLVPCDNPAAATRHLGGVEDQDLKKYVPAAAKPIDEAPELACLELGEWYARLAGDAASHACEPLLIRAEAYLERFLSLHEAQDLNRTRATLTLEKVTKAYEEATADRWISLLPRVNPKRHAVIGPWIHQGGAVAITRGTAYGRVMIPAILRGDYDMTIRFTRTAGADTVGVLLPVGDTQTLVHLSGRGGTYHGMGPIGGVSPSANQTTVRPGNIENGRPYEMQIRIRLDNSHAAVHVLLDGEMLIRWRGTEKALGQIGPWEIPRPDCPALLTYGTQVVFAEVTVRTHSCRPKQEGGS